jgi:DegV family protein with EDD domain
MNKYVIITDSGTDFTKEMAAECDVNVIDLMVSIEGQEPIANSDVDPKELYAMLRDKKGISTSAINLESAKEEMEKRLKEGCDVLYLGFSSGLSSTFRAGELAAEELREEYPDRKVYALDTLCASLGQGLIVYLAAMMRKNGADIEEVKDFVENNKLRLCHWFTVDDLFFLKRGGRVSGATAVVGTMLGIKPVMHVDNDGKLIKIGVARGRKASVDALFDKMKESILGDPKDATVFISHGDCLEDAEYLGNRIKNELGVKKLEIGFVGPVIGSHSGPGTLALFHLGTGR